MFVLSETQRRVAIKMILSNLLICAFLFFTLPAFSQNSHRPAHLKTSHSIKASIEDSTASTKNADSLIGNDGVEDKIIDTIFKLTEVKERGRYIRTQTKDNTHLKVWIEDMPDLRGHKYYWIKVGEDNGISLVTHFNFFVYPDSMRIMYYDTRNDREMTLAKWRKVNGR